MWKKLKRLGLFLKALLFTVVVHGALLGLLFYSVNWVDDIERGGVEPIQAVAIPARDLEAAQAAKALKELEDLKRAREAEERKQKALAEKQRKAEEKRKAAEKKKKLEVEKKRKAEEHKKKLEVEKKRKTEEHKKKLETEKKRKAEEDKKKLEAEKKRKAEAEKKRKEEEAKRLRAEQLRKQLEKEQRVKTKNDADDALSALVDRIATAVENNWRRPRTSQSGLTVTIRVKVARDGRVASARVTRSSGDPFFDQSAELAVHKASPLPFPDNPEYYEFINEFDFKFNPDAF